MRIESNRRSWMKALPMALAATLFAGSEVGAHEGGGPDVFVAGVPGDAEAPARTYDLTIQEASDGTMSFGVRDIVVERGEQIRFVVKDDGRLPHEFRIDSKAGNAEHKTMMEKMPGMVHHDANAITIASGETATLLWRFSKPGTYEFACLLPGHYEAGMHGAIVVSR